MLVLLGTRRADRRRRPVRATGQRGRGSRHGAAHERTTPPPEGPNRHEILASKVRKPLVTAASQDPANTHGIPGTITLAGRTGT